jgi:hypothetical protein
LHPYDDLHTLHPALGAQAMPACILLPLLLLLLLLLYSQADCDIVVTLCMQVIRRMHGKLQWLSEPLPVSSRRQSINPSGLSTPRSSAVMQV